MSFRNFLGELEKKDTLLKIGKNVSSVYEIARMLKKNRKATVFKNVDEGKIRVAGNVYGSRERIAMGLDIKIDDMISKMQNALSSKGIPKVISGAPCQEIVEDKVDLREFPILKHFAKDGGPYMTASILVAKDSKGIRNLSFHRLQQIGKDKFAIRLVPRDLYNIFKNKEQNEEPLEVAAFLGVDIGVELAATTSSGPETDEYRLANSLSNDLKLTKCQTVDLEVPSSAEIIMEGKLLAGERTSEGPFADITGTYDAVRQQPIFKVEHITRREDTIYQAILPSGAEHQLLMGIPRESVILEEMKKVVDVKNVTLTKGGSGWLHAIGSINKKEENDGKKAIEAAFRGHSSLKHVVIVDEDIDIYDMEEVEWAIATRFRADEDSVIKRNVKGSSLDPTADPESRLGCKTGIDATKDLEDPEKFEKAKIPEKRG